MIYFSLWCFSIFVKYYFQVSFKLKVILSIWSNNSKFRDGVPSIWEGTKYLRNSCWLTGRRLQINFCWKPDVPWRLTNILFLSYFRSHNDYGSWLFFCKKKFLSVGASGMLWAVQWVDQWVDQWEMYVCHTNQIGSIKFLVVKVNSMWEDLIPIKLRTAILILL